MAQKLIIFRLMLVLISCLTFYLTKLVYKYESVIMPVNLNRFKRMYVSFVHTRSFSHTISTTTDSGSGESVEDFWPMVENLTLATKEPMEIVVTPQKTMMSKSGKPLDLHMFQSKPMTNLSAVVDERELFHPVIIEPSLKPYRNPPICGDGSTAKLLILVISAVQNFNQRNLLRSNWANQAKFNKVHSYDVKVLFVVAFDAKSNGTQDRVQVEAETQEDILQINVVESYEALVNKELSAFKWIYQQCFPNNNVNHQRDFIAKTDDNMFVNIFAAVEMLILVHQGHDLKRAVFGDVVPGALPERRKSKWVISIAEYPYTYFPYYTRGGFYMISAGILHDVIQGAPNEHFVPFEDVFITGIVMQRLNVTFFSFSRFGILMDATTAADVTAANKVFVHSDDKGLKNKLWTHAIMVISNKLPRGWVIQQLMHSFRGTCPAHSCDHGHSAALKKLSSTASGPKENAFEMVSATLRFGSGVTAELGADLRSTFNAKNTLVLTDNNLVHLSPVKKVLDSLTKFKIPYTVFDRCRVEPTDTSFKEAIEFARNGQFDSFVAVGGGSVMDTAKAANIYTANPSVDFLDYICEPHGKNLAPENAMLPLICVPTTAGTGSETTSVAVFDLDEHNIKMALRSRLVKPHLGLVDPDHMQTLPRNVAIYSGFDVLCHALESFTALPYYERPKPSSPQTRPVYQGSNPASDVWARQALKILREHFRNSVLKRDMNSQTEILMASSFAGMGFGNAGVHLCHGLSYPISGQVKNHRCDDYPDTWPMVPHGLSVVLTAPADFEFTAPACPERHLEAARLLGYTGSSNSLADAGTILADTVRGYMRDFQVANGLLECGFTQSDVTSLTEGAIQSLSALTLAPKNQTFDEIASIYEKSLTVY